jgi:hypothetical protein
MIATYRGGLADVARSIPGIAVDRRLARAGVAALVIGGYIALGFAFGLGADGYLLLGIPITIAFQLLVVRRPLRALWLRDAPPMPFTARSIAATMIVAIAPASVAVSGVRDGNAVLMGYGLAAMVGAVGAVYAIRAMDRDSIRSTVRAILITSAILVSIMVTYRVVSGGFDGNVASAGATVLISLATRPPSAAAPH